MDKSVEIIDCNTLINGRNIFKFISDYNCGATILIQNHLRDIGREIHNNTKIIGNFAFGVKDFIIPDIVDIQYRLIIIRPNKSIFTKLCSKSHSYTININGIDGDINNVSNTHNDSQQNHIINIDGEMNSVSKPYNNSQQIHIINNKSYRTLSQFPSNNDVYLVESKDTENKQLLYVYKRISYKNSQVIYNRTSEEIRAMKLLKGNRRFVQLVDYYHDQNNQIFHIITEYCKGGDLYQKHKHLTDSNLIFEEPEIWDFLVQLFNILLDLEKHRIVHNDIKPLNIFIEGDLRNWSLILGDFGGCLFPPKGQTIANEIAQIIEDNCVIPKQQDNDLLSVFTPNSTLKSVIYGTPGFLAPVSKIYSTEFVRYLTNHPDENKNHRVTEYYTQILESKVPSISKRIVFISKERYSEDLANFISLLLDPNPKNRESLKGLLSQYIKSITFNNIIKFDLNIKFDYNSILMNTQNITTIIFGDQFNQQLHGNSLPPNLISLTFGCSYNRPIPIGVLPKSLVSLSFGEDFNQKLEPGALPDSIVTLRFGYGFNQVFTKGVLPSSLKSLTMGGYNHELEGNELPQHLEELELSFYTQSIQAEVFPSTIKSLTLGTFSNGFDQQLAVGVLPQSLERLRFGSFNQKIGTDVLPNTLKTLSFDRNFNQPFNIGVLPPSLESLSLPPNYNHVFKQDVLPHLIKSLNLDDYSQPIGIGVLPSSLLQITILQYSRSTNQNFDSGKRQIVLQNNRIPLPESLESIIIGVYKDFKKQGILPKLEGLLINGDGQFLEALKLTDSLEELQFIQDYYPEYATNIINYLSKSPNYQLQGKNIIALLVFKYEINKD
ncbi:FNIP repeat-containing protein [Heterostelium album PN500]|uniref:FNIP repeat-containing protein n=1 Tax=Heterostelium pallidum (strain ATCC 26659 / Pp 5 / PN500) TaxID=670386 RepID=D3BBG9_HETP5|nr:FNIP repeat-containing protein [Heterostelium album PN500]EFA81002.1 FNIP repeat-containing protein [Heterostelium album PN500]|eukprot:XP_020433120.1 FNIP repeat-containing protein [Heterostelium album PN500]